MMSFAPCWLLTACLFNANDKAHGDEVADSNVVIRDLREEQSEVHLERLEV